MTRPVPELTAPGLHEQLVASVQESIYVVDRAQRIVYVNHSLEETATVAASEFAGRTSAEMFPSLHAQGLGVLLDRALAGERLYPPDMPFRNARTDTEGWLSIRVSPLRSPSGAVLGAIVVSRDVTERKRVEEALAASKNHLRAILESEPECVKLTGPDGTLLHINPAGLTMLEADTSAEVLGRNICELVSPADREAFVALNSRVFGGETGSLEFTITSLKGATLRVETHAAPLRDASGNAVAAVAVTRDVTGQRLLEMQLRQTQKLESLGLLAGGIAHDFNNILLVVAGNCDLALMHLEPDHPVRELVTEISQAADRGTSLTRQLLAFSRRQVLQPRTVNLNALIAETEKMLRRVVGEDIELTTALDPAVHPVTADPGNLTQVLLNLTVNAREAMPGGGSLRIETSNVAGGAVLEGGGTSDPFVRLAISDTGCGMAADVRARVFEPFFTTKPAGQGTGLGLAVVHGAVKQSGGSITIDSEVGRGTTVAICLPAAADVTGSVGEQDAASVPRGTETILVVEDDDRVRRYVVRALQSHGYRVVEAADGRSALDLLETLARPVDLLITDVVMPDMNGREVAEALCARCPGLSVLYTSGYTDDEVVRRGVMHADVRFLPKPYTSRDLLQKVQECLRG